MPTLSSLLGSGVKSIQRGVLTIPAGGTANATIASVNTNKTLLNWLGATSAFGGAGNEARIVLTNSTTITGTNSAGYATTVSWELQEFN